MYNTAWQALASIAAPRYNGVMVSLSKRHSGFVVTTRASAPKAE